MTGGDSAATRADVAEARRWRRMSASDAAATFGIPAAAMFAFATTWFLLSPMAENVGRAVLLALIIGNVVIAGTFATLIGVRLWQVATERRRKRAGASVHLQLVGLFCLVAATPALFAFLFAFTIMRSSLNDVFGDRVTSSIDAARGLANDYIQEKYLEDERHLTQIEFDLNNDSLIGVTPATTPILFRQRLFEQAYGRGLAAIVIVDADRRIVARAEMVEADFALPNRAIFDKIDAAAAAGEPQGKWFTYGANDGDALDFLRGMKKSEVLDGGYIVTYRAMRSNISSGLIGIRNIGADWRDVRDQRDRLERVFFAGYIVMALIVLFGAIWAAMRAATRIVEPIGRLVRMAQRVSSGDLGARVDVFRRDGELGALARSMNHMTAQLQTQRDDLIETTRQFDRRRRFTEAVLSNVSAGVVGIDADSRITIANRSAEELLGLDGARSVGAPLGALAPELSTLVTAARGAVTREAAGQIEIDRDGRLRTLNVRVVCDQSDDGGGAVATFDDVTELMAAHRSAAWGDVARRIAHEIKNPLTPIQLSAERLRRKYQSEVVTQPEIFDKCTDTIIRHVSDIRRMVDEFSSFARMPEPVISVEDVTEIVKSTVFTQRVSFPEISFDVRERDGEDAAPVVSCDDRLIGQALGNILKNACESIDARLVANPDPPGRVRVRIAVAGDAVRIEIADNGVGLPKAQRERLTEPYMTTRAKGTGLGLAIVKKVIEEHGGTLSFDDCAELGATGARVTVVLPRAAIGEATTPADAGAERTTGLAREPSAEIQTTDYQVANHQAASAPGENAPEQEALDGELHVDAAALRGAAAAE
ncbi:MAG: HAMP domain-containing protein [Alphaproteobacteria bacterium]|nr:HAMP domain-containing protein [Alphaproteobacteria bacterium]